MTEAFGVSLHSGRVVLSCAGLPSCMMVDVTCIDLTNGAGHDGADLGPQAGLGALGGRVGQRR